MADSVTFKDEKSFDKLDERVRYQWDARGEFSIADAKTGGWAVVHEGDKIERYEDGYTVVPKDAK